MLVSKGRIEMDPAKLEGIQEWPKPKNLKDVQSFLGFANFYQKFIANYVDLSQPLDELKKKDQAWEWMDRRQTAFNSLKQVFLVRPVLATPDPWKPFTIETDASLFTSGGALLQEDANGDLKPCGYISKVFNLAERNYPIFDRELLAIIRALKAWRHYLLGQTFTIRCDHKNLMHYRESRNLNGRQTRWLNVLSEFDYQFQYTPGKEMVVADVLSRRADHQAKDGTYNITLFPPENFLDAMEVTIEDQELKDQIRARGTKDDLMIEAIEALKYGKLPPIRSALSDWHTNDGLLWYKGRLYIPDDINLQRDLVKQHHEGIVAGHPGQYGTNAIMMRSYWWPRMSVFVKNFVEGCALCQQNKVNTHPTIPPLMPIKADKDTLPFSTVSIDFITDLPESMGFTALYVVVDHNLSKGIVLIPCTKEETALSTATLFHDHVYRHFGLPRAMISDRGPQFASQVFRELCTKIGVQSRLSMAYHSQTDGQTEWMNREIEAYLRIYCGSHLESWAEYLPDLEFVHNHWINANSGKAPFELIMGYLPTAIPTLAITTKYLALEDRLRELCNIRKEVLAAHEMARVRMTERITRTFQPFEKGQKVWLEAKNLNVGGSYRKLRSLQEGPFIISDVLGPLTYRLKLPTSWTMHPVFHAALLSPYKQTAVHGPAYAEPPPELVKGEDEWEVEAILRHRKYRGGKVRYLVKWKEYPTSENSWKKEEDLEHSKQLIHAYKRQNDLEVTSDTDSDSDTSDDEG